MNTVPLVDLAAQWRSVGPAVRAAMDEVHAATSYTMEPVWMVLSGAALLALASAVRRYIP